MYLNREKILKQIGFEWRRIRFQFISVYIKYFRFIEERWGGGRNFTLFNWSFSSGDSFKITGSPALSSSPNPMAPSHPLPSPLRFEINWKVGTWKGINLSISQATCPNHQKPSCFLINYLYLSKYNNLYPLHLPFSPAYPSFSLPAPLFDQLSRQFSANFVCKYSLYFQDLTLIPPHLIILK